MKKLLLVLLSLLLPLISTLPARAACTPGTNWTVSWTDSFGQTAYQLQAPCKVYIGIPFNIVATVTDASFPNADVAFSWSIKDNGAVIAGGGGNWLTLAAGQWQKVHTQTYSGSPIDHTIEFGFTDLGEGAGHTSTHPG